MFIEKMTKPATNRTVTTVSKKTRKLHQKLHDV